MSDIEKSLAILAEAVRDLNENISGLRKDLRDSAEGASFRVSQRIVDLEDKVVEIASAFANRE